MKRMSLILRQYRTLIRCLVACSLGATLLSVRWMAVFAQSDCGIATRFDYPIDTARFQLAQDFGAPSPRHQGRYHTGEDWYGGRDASLGQPVRAAADGRVTYSYPLGWGRDGGVVVIEHTLPDGSIVYTQYGHLFEAEGVVFPQRLSCVTRGQVIGVIGDARPAPHAHFEVRLSQPDTPGPGYASGDIIAQGWRKPAQFIANANAWAHPAHRWHILTSAGPAGPSAPPLLLNDNSLLYLDGATLRRATPDGRVLWRITLDRPAVGIVAYAGQSLLVFADGVFQTILLDGALGDSWRAALAFGGPPLVVGDMHLFPLQGRGLAALRLARRELVWQTEIVPPFQQWAASGVDTAFTIGIITQDNEMMTLAGDGRLLNRALLRDSGAFAAAADGALLAYTRGGLWRVGADGVWDIALDDVPPNRGGGAALTTTDGGLLLFDGATLSAYTAEGALQWATPIPNISGQTTLTPYLGLYLLVTTHGHIIAITGEGRACAQLRIYGDDRSQQWHRLGSDGLLRVAIADQIIGLDWRAFTVGC